MTAVSIAPHPLLRAGLFVTRFPAPLEALASPPAVAAILAGDRAPIPAGVERDEDCARPSGTCSATAATSPPDAGSPRALLDGAGWPTASVPD